MTTTTLCVAGWAWSRVRQTLYRQTSIAVLGEINFHVCILRLICDSHATQHSPKRSSACQMLAHTISLFLVRFTYVSVRCFLFWYLICCSSRSSPNHSCDPSYPQTRHRDTPKTQYRNKTCQSLQQRKVSIHETYRSRKSALSVSLYWNFLSFLFCLCLMTGYGVSGNAASLVWHCVYLTMTMTLIVRRTRPILMFNDAVPSCLQRDTVFRTMCACVPAFVYV